MAYKSATSAMTLAGILGDAGVLPPNCRRVVIDIRMGSPVILHFECIGDQRLIELLRNPEIVVALKEASSGGAVSSSR